jgi:hypothetical protein
MLDQANNRRSKPLVSTPFPLDGPTPKMGALPQDNVLLRLNPLMRPISKDIGRKDEVAAFDSLGELNWTRSALLTQKFESERSASH